MIEEISQTSQGGTRFSHKILVVKFNVARGNLTAVLPALVHHPVPVEGRLEQAAGFPAPGKGPEFPHLHERQGNVASVPDNVHKERVRYVPLDSSHVENVV